jgi:hypothetical protein
MGASQSRPEDDEKVYYNETPIQASLRAVLVGNWKAEPV